MVRVNRRQRHILNCLDKKFPNCLTYEVLLAELGNMPGDTGHIDYLRSKGLIGISLTSFVYPNGLKSHDVPKDSWITLDGRAKLRETFFKNLMLFLGVIIMVEVAIILAITKP